MPRSWASSMRSLADVDDALGGADAVKQRRMLIPEILADSYNAIDAMEPSLGRPPALVAASDPDSWNTKPVAAAKAPAAKKEGPKARETPMP